MDKQLDLSPDMSKDIIEIVISTMRLCVKHQNLSLFIRLYQFMKHSINIDFFDILKKSNINFLILCIQFNSYELLTHFLKYYNLDIKIWLDQCTHQELQLISQYVRVTDAGSIKPEYSEYNRPSEWLILMRLFVHSLYNLSYNAMLIVYNMCIYFNKQHPDILSNPQLILKFMKKIYQEDSLRFLINNNYLTITDTVTHKCELRSHDRNYSVTMFDLIYNQYIILQRQHNYHKCSESKELIKYIIVELYHANYNAVQNYLGFYRDKIIYLLETYSTNMFEMSVIDEFLIYDENQDKPTTHEVEVDSNIFDDEHKQMGIYY